MSWRVTPRLHPGRGRGLPEAGDLFPMLDTPPVLVADEPDPAQPDEWRLHAYFDRQPGWDELKALEALAADSDPVIERLDATTTG